jgi:hypothetical protein
MSPSRSRRLRLSGCGDSEERVGEHGQGDVPAPGVIAADLVFVEADLPFRGLEAFLDGPAVPATRISSSSPVLTGP